MTTPASATHLWTAFDSLVRGADAPDWITDGVRAAWFSAQDDIAATLLAVSENATFRISLGGVPRIVVRVQRPGYHAGALNAQSELAWVEALVRDVGIRTPRPVRGVDGAFVQHLLGPSATRWTAVAFTFAPGSVLEDLAIEDAHFVQLGRLTAFLHQHSRTWQEPAAFERFHWDIADLAGPTARWGTWERAVSSESDRRMLRAAQDRAVAVISADGKSPSSWGLIHSDLRPSNVLVDDGELTVIDFDDCGYTWRLYDFGASLTFYEHRPDALRMAANWLDGYREVSSLSRSELELAGALSMIRRLTMLGWSTTHRSDALPVDLWDENLPGTVEVGRRYLSDPLWLVDP